MSYTSTPLYIFMAWCLVKHRIRLHDIILRKGLSVLVGLEDGCAPEPVWTRWRGENRIPSSAGYRTPYLPLLTSGIIQHIPSHNTATGAVYKMGTLYQYHFGRCPLSDIYFIHTTFRDLALLPYSDGFHQTNILLTSRMFI